MNQYCNDMRNKKQLPNHPMTYEWAATENLSPLYHASDDFGFALCNRSIRLHTADVHRRDDIPEYWACKKCVKLFVKMVKTNCVEVRKERINLGELQQAGEP